jgi:transcriptional regulator with XRE-family HTH domain
MPDKIDAEVQRLRELLVKAVEENRYTAKALERKLGMAGGSTGKILRGQITLSVRHLLAILDAAGIPWAAFFQVAYPQPGQQGPSLTAPPGLPKTGPAAAPEPAATAVAEPDRPLTEADRQILTLLRRLVRLSETDEGAEPQV